MLEFTSRKIERFKLARKIYRNVGLPTVKNFKHMVSTNTIENFPISVADIINDERIYGPSIPSHKGKPTKSKPRLVIKYGIQIPSEIYKNNSKIELLIYLVCINGDAFLVYIDKQVKYRSIVHITSKN